MNAPLPKEEQARGENEGNPSNRKARLRERLAQSRGAFVAAGEALSAAALRRPAGDGSDWTAKDPIDRVAYAEASMLPMIGGPLQGWPHRDASDADLDRRTSHPAASETTVEGIDRIIAHHERDHAKELQAIAASE